ncbi:hypothetical protein ACFL4T_08750 [candidate division KSB1 bacterium]
MSTRYVESAEFIRDILNKSPNLIFIVNAELKVYLINTTASEILGVGTDFVYLKTNKEKLHCIHSFAGQSGCGEFSYCADCIVRYVVKTALETGSVVKRQSNFRLRNNSNSKDIVLSVIGEPFRYNGEDLVILTLEELTESGSSKYRFPICACCKKVRDDKYMWEDIQSLSIIGAGAGLTQTLCPECVEKYYPALVDFQ